MQKTLDEKLASDKKELQKKSLVGGNEGIPKRFLSYSTPFFLVDISRQHCLSINTSNK